jgi:hypothetical protein
MQPKGGDADTTTSRCAYCEFNTVPISHIELIVKLILLYGFYLFRGRSTMRQPSNYTLIMFSNH